MDLSQGLCPASCSYLPLSAPPSDQPSSGCGDRFFFWSLMVYRKYGLMIFDDIWFPYWILIVREFLEETGLFWEPSPSRRFLRTRNGTGPKTWNEPRSHRSRVHWMATIRKIQFSAKKGGQFFIMTGNGRLYQYVTCHTESIWVLWYLTISLISCAICYATKLVSTARN